MSDDGWTKQFITLSLKILVPIAEGMKGSFSGFHTGVCPYKRISTPD
jgi:hypothetical protein